MSEERDNTETIDSYKLEINDYNLKFSADYIIDSNHKSITADMLKYFKKELSKFPFFDENKDLTNLFNLEIKVITIDDYQCYHAIITMEFDEVKL